MSQQPYQQQKKSVRQQQSRHRYTFPSTIVSGLLNGLQNVFQARKQSRKDQSSLSLSQSPTDMFTDGGPQQILVDSVLPDYEQLLTGTIQQPNLNGAFQQQKPNGVVMPMQSEHELSRQNSVQNICGIFPIEPSEHAQSQVCSNYCKLTVPSSFLCILL